MHGILNVALKPRSFLCILPNIKEEVNERRKVKINISFVSKEILAEKFYYRFTNNRIILIKTQYNTIKFNDITSKTFCK